VAAWLSLSVCVEVAIQFQFVWVDPVSQLKAYVQCAYGFAASEFAAQSIFTFIKPRILLVS